MPNFILKNPIRFSEGSGSTITPSDTNITLDSPQTVTISIGQNVAPTQNLIFSDVSSSIIQESGSTQIQENSFENINTFTANTDILTNLDVLEDLSINGTVVAEEFLSELSQSVTIFKSGSTIFGDTIDDVHDVTGSLNTTGSLILNDYSIKEISNDTSLNGGSSTAVVTENSFKNFVDSTDNKRNYLRKSFTHTGSFVSINTASFTAVTASAPTGFTATSKEDFMFFNNGAFMETDALNIQQSGSKLFLLVNNNSIGYDLSDSDEIVAFGKFNA